MKTKIFIASLCFFIQSLCYAQGHTNFEAINSDIWLNFTKAFEDLDFDLFKSLHTTSLIRVNGDGKSVKDLNAYMKGYEGRWSNKTLNQTISFRFLERISNDNTASERGIYKLTVHLNTDKETSYYGKFHVFLVKVDTVWKIQVDYDSSENNTITEASYQKAFAQDDFGKF